MAEPRPWPRGVPRKPVGWRHSIPGFDLRDCGPAGPVTVRKATPEELAALEERLRKVGVSLVQQNQSPVLTREAIIRAIQEHSDWGLVELARHFGYSRVGWFVNAAERKGINIGELRAMLRHQGEQPAADQQKEVETMVAAPRLSSEAQDNDEIVVTQPSELQKSGEDLPIGLREVYRLEGRLPLGKLLARLQALVGLVGDSTEVQVRLEVRGHGAA